MSYLFYNSVVFSLILYGDFFLVSLWMWICISIVCFLLTDMNLCVEECMVLLFLSLMFCPITSHFHISLKFRVTDYLILCDVKYLQVWCLVNVMEFRPLTVSIATLSSLVHYIWFMVSNSNGIVNRVVRKTSW